MELLPQKIEQYSEHYDDHSLWNKIKSAAAKAGRKVIYNALLLYYMLTDATIPLKHKRLIVGVLGYFILPIDLIPGVARQHHSGHQGKGRIQMQRIFQDR